MDIGERLRHAREAKGLTIEALSRSTRVQPRILAAIERNDPASLPPRPYGRGFVRTYASEVGLSPEETVREFFSQFVGAEATEAPWPPAPRVLPPDRARWLWPVSAVLGYAAIGAFVIVAGRWAMHGGGEAGAVGTAGIVAPAPAPAAEPAPVPTTPAPPPAGIVVELQAERPVWIAAVADGRRVVYREIQPGERVSLRADREMSIRTGDAGAVLWRVDGRDAVPMGAPGEVRTVRLVPDPSRKPQDGR